MPRKAMDGERGHGSLVAGHAGRASVALWPEPMPAEACGPWYRGINLCRNSKIKPETEHTRNFA